MKTFVTLALVAATLAPVAAQAHAVVMQNATVAELRTDVLTTNPGVEIIHVSGPKLIVPLPKPRPIPVPGPWCLSCPPFDMDERVLIPLIQR